MARSLSPLYVEPKLPSWWDWSVVILTVASIAILLVEMGMDPASTESFVLRWIDTGICGVFFVDFGLRAAKAGHGWEFAKRNWIDLLGAIPLVGPLHTLRVVRLVRILRFTRIAVLTRRLMRRFDVAMPTETLGTLGVVALIVWLGAASAFFGFEEGANEGIDGFDDALWWSMTTLSTVGYGDLYPETTGGRVVALVTMVMGVGVLGTLAATIATAFLDLRERGRKGLRRYRMSDHLLVLNWNEKAPTAIDDFRHDARFRNTKIIIVADLEETPIEDEQVRFVRGEPGKTEVLRRAAADKASVAIVFARNPRDPRSDHETALIVLALREVCAKAKISAELVDPDHREFLRRAGCDAVVDSQAVASTLLVRSVQDLGVSEVVEELLSNKLGSEIYRVRIPDAHVGSTFRDFCVAMLDGGSSVIGLARGRRNLLNPSNDTTIEAGDEAFVVAKEPPRV
jgi:voltage-gated potassium channel